MRSNEGIEQQSLHHKEEVLMTNKCAFILSSSP